MEFQDKALRCVDCGTEFVWTAGEQLFFADKNFKNEPKRCKACKAKRANRPMTASPARERVETQNTHGTGCALSSAVSCLLARGLGLEAAIGEAKRWLTQALAAGAKMRLGAGAGPPDHLWAGKFETPLD